MGALARKVVLSDAKGAGFGSRVGRSGARARGAVAGVRGPIGGRIGESVLQHLGLPTALPGGPAALIAFAAVAGLALGVAELTDPLHVPGLYTSVGMLTTAASASLAMLLLARRPSPNALRYGLLGAALASALFGVLVLDLWRTIGLRTAGVVGNLAFVLGTALAYAAIVPAIYGRLDRRGFATAGLDGLIMMLAGATVLLSGWQSGLGASSARELLMPGLAAVIVGSAGAAAVAALYMRAAPSVGGIWAGIIGTSVLGVAWIAILSRLVSGNERGVSEGLAFSAGVVVIAFGWLTWEDRTSGGRAYVAVSRFLGDWLPIVAILLCVGLGALPHPQPAGIDPTPLGTTAVVFVAVVRQRYLITIERSSSRRLASQAKERATASVSLSRLEPAATPAATAGRVCAEALRLDGIDFAAMIAFGPSDATSVLAAGRRADDETIAADDAAGPGRPARIVEFERETRLPKDVAARLRAAAQNGPWFAAGRPGGAPERSRPRYSIEFVDVGPSTWAEELAGWTGSVAYAPIRSNDVLIALVAMGSHDDRGPGELPLSERLATVAEFAVVSGALIGPQLADHWRRIEVRRQLAAVISNQAFMPVFQPVVELASGRSIGFEALTRFSDGTRPDQRFIDAAAVGMAVALETAVIRRQLRVAEALPPDAWLSLNVSPDLAASVIPLIAALEGTDRAIVLEITEHMRIDDYERLVESLAMVRGRARLAVDDAGAGYAGLRQILELKPHFVKLDVSLVRSIDRDAAQQALVAGMAHFARNAGCELIAEGIETPAELETLRRLGVELGQGYLLGKPAPIS